MMPIRCLAFASALCLIASSAAAEDFIGIARDAKQVWFLSASAIVTDAQGEIRTHVYQTYVDGPEMGGKKVQFADWLVAYNCSEGTFHPVTATFMGEGFAFIGSSNFPPQPKEIEAGPTSAWGLKYACDPSQPGLETRRLSGKDWREVADGLHSKMGGH